MTEQDFSMHEYVSNITFERDNMSEKNRKVILEVI